MEITIISTLRKYDCGPALIARADSTAEAAKLGKWIGRLANCLPYITGTTSGVLSREANKIPTPKREATVEADPVKHYYSPELSDCCEPEFEV